MKEVMLEELNNFTTNNNSQMTTNETNTDSQLSPNRPIIAKPNIMKGSSISPSDLSKKLKEKNKNEEVESINQVEETPMVKNAFSDMIKTLDDRKKRIDEE